MFILFSTVHDGDPWLRQTPKFDGVWGDCVYVFDDAEGKADWLAVCDQPRAGLATRIPRARRILFVTEPPEIACYPASYLNQFGTVVSPAPCNGYTGRQLRRQPALSWHYGIDRHDATRPPMLWQELASGKEKTRELSVICSDKTATRQQRLRLAFVRRLRQRLGRRVDIFGRNIATFADKAEAIAPYRYHIVLENNAIDHFWTEKLADAFLGESYPIYSGCRNIGAYFDPGSFSPIDIENADKAIDEIEDIVGSNRWSERIDLIRESRSKVMNEYNVFAVVKSIIAQAETTARSKPQLVVAETIAPPKRAAKIVRKFMKWKQKLSARMYG